MLAGTGRIEFQKLSLVKFTLPRYRIYQLTRDPHFLESVKIQEGVLYKKKNILVAKAGSYPAKWEVLKLPKNYFFLKLKVGLATPWGILLDRKGESYQLLQLDPDQRSIRHFQYVNGVEQKVTSYSFPNAYPPYTVQIFFNGTNYFFEQNGKFVARIPHSKMEPRIEILIPSETKQYFYQFDLYQ